ncbi:multicopper oxidase family protein [Paramicrobacterium chengjingii]|uniref:Multicopper oxidase domain-containing protein n=1 Tax=Paramicrobacterium chengjingii TaxID=2769067 RepID=A0ABX6YH19_9MICO|nr:multicopper oxidase domain-containing protein [Microbacterium chengjingii]QPZ37915.1 multicopper oxidase domain-containing protein [Microbacterium chengjingii]
MRHTPAFRGARSRRSHTSTHRLRRPRAVLATASILVIGGLGLTIGITACAPSSPAVDTVGAVDFETPLAIPPLAERTVDADGTVHVDLTARSGSTPFVDGTETPTLGYNGSYLGPTIKVHRDEHFAPCLTNELSEVTTLHWHGMHLPAAADGGPHQPVEPGQQWCPEWTIDQPAATLWYHPHPHEETERQVGLGLAGMLQIEDDVEAALPLPRDYGVDDVPVVIQDARFSDEGEFQKTQDFVGTLGDTLLVNGTIGPYFEATTNVVRLRILNASPARVYDFAFDDDREFAMIASGGGLLEKPAQLDHIRLSPAERAEILVKLEPGETVTLRSNPPNLGESFQPITGSAGHDDRFDVLQLRAASELDHVGEIPETLTTIEPLDPADAVGERSFTLNGHNINDKQMKMDRIDAVATVNTTEIWNVLNEMPAPHNFHVHDVQFQVLSVDGMPPSPELAGWKDTIYLEPDVQYRIIMEFTDYADGDNPYMFHCHLLRHEDAGMMGQFLVMEPGANVPSRWVVDETPGDDDDSADAGRHQH